MGHKNEMSEEKRAVIKKLNLMSNDFMKCFLQDIPCAESLIRRVLHNHDLVVTEVHTEYEQKNLLEHASRLDVYARDADGKLYNIEVQSESKDFPPKRTRYYNGIIDTNTLAKGESYNQLPELYIIIIGENDILKENLPIYHVGRIIKETGTAFADAVSIIYVNCEIAEDTNLSLEKVLELAKQQSA